MAAHDEALPRIVILDPYYERLALKATGLAKLKS